MKEGESNSKGLAMAGQTMDVSITKRIAQNLKGTQAKSCMEYTSRSLEIVSKETLCQR
jgi:hypothetical protein